MANRLQFVKAGFFSLALPRWCGAKSTTELTAKGGNGRQGGQGSEYLQPLSVQSVLAAVVWWSHPNITALFLRNNNPADCSAWLASAGLRAPCARGMFYTPFSIADKLSKAQMKCILCESFQQLHVISPNPISKMTTPSINCCDAAKLHCAVLIHFLRKHSCIDKLKTISAPCAGDSWRSVCSSFPATSYADPMIKLGCSCYRRDLLPLSSTCSLTVLTRHTGSAPGKWV